jgi:excisionase family DNA binding protein
MAKRGGEAKELYTASEVANFCQVDLKTIHNWAERGEIRHFRTPGRHLRFRRADVLEFLRKYGYPVPSTLKPAITRVHVIDEDAAVVSALEQALSPRFEVQSFGDPVDGLVALGQAPPDVLVLDVSTTRLDALAAIRRLRSMEATQHVRVIVHSARTDLRQAALDAGAVLFIAKPETTRVRDGIQTLLEG